MINKTLVFASVMTLLCFGLFQNCAGGLPSNLNTTNASSATNYTPTSISNQCLLNQTLVASGTVEQNVYTVSSAASGVACPAPETLTCTNGTWVGSSAIAGTNVSSTVAYTNCAAANQSCTINGVTVMSGDSVPGYSSSTVPSGSSCTSAETTLTCTDGAVSTASGAAVTAYPASSCSVSATVGQYQLVGQIIDAPAYLPYCGTETPSTCNAIGSQCYITSGSSLDGLFSGYMFYYYFRCD